MRQRGAGSRAVNADFGFSFAGFSAPTSQEATPIAAPIEPMAKRRKTIAQDAIEEQDLDRGSRDKASVLDRRERTKAGRAKRRFVVEDDGDHSAHKRDDGRDRDDSFAAGLGDRKHSKRLAEEKRKPSEEDSARKEKCDGVPVSDATRTTMKPRGRRKAGENAALVDEGQARQIEGLKDEPSNKDLMPGTRKTAAQKSKKEAIPEETECDIEQQTVSKAAVAAVRSKAPRAAKTRTRKGAQRQDLDAEGSSSAAVATAAEASEPGSLLDLETTASMNATTAAADKPTRRRKDQMRQEEEQAPKASRAEKTLALPDDGQAVETHAEPVKSSRKAATKSKPTKQTTLQSTPPQLERRPLQEGDANRSPSPRKSPEKAAPSVKNGAVPENNRVKRKRTDVADDATSRRKARKIRIQPDEQTRDVKEAGLALKSELEPSAEARTDAAQETADSERSGNAKLSEQRLSETQDALKRQRTTKARHAKQPSKAQPDTSDTKKRQRDEEEDIDWLFDAPNTKSYGAAKAPPAKAPSAPRKTKLADIDLDDLIANVAAFAQAGDGGSSSIGGGLNVGKVRRAGRR